MKFIELKENEPLEVIEVITHLLYPAWGEPYTTEKDKKYDVVEQKQIQMRIFTDGEIEKESDAITKKIEEYYIGKKKYKYDVDTLRTKNIYFKNYSYVITYLIATEYMTVGKVRGWFDVVKDVVIYLQNPKDKKALKTTKEVIKLIEKRNNNIDYSSIFGMLCSQENELQKFEIGKISNNVYSLKKRRM